MVDLRDEVVGPDVFCGDEACARDDHELAFFTFCSRTGDSYKITFQYYEYQLLHLHLHPHHNYLTYNYLSLKS